MEIKKLTNLHGELTVPGDKSISHRAVMFGSLAKGTTKITHFLEGADCLSTISCFRKMGIDIENNSGEILVHGKGLHGLSAPVDILDVGNSGTTTRLISGILAGQNFVSELTGDDSIQSRPMKRIMTPLLSMGADIASIKGNNCVPLRIAGHPLKAIHYDSPVASAQVKSCVLLAGMYSDGITSVTEPVLSRNHTEIMLNYFGARVTSEGTTVIKDAKELKVKESDRILVMAENLSRMGADLTPTEDGKIIHGGKPLHGAEIDSYLDHRVAMSFAVAGLLCDGPLSIKGGDCVKISYPEFYEDLYRLGE